MVDITHKKNTLRIATAEALLKVSKIATIEAIENNRVPKGDVFEMSRAAGLLGVKKHQNYYQIVIHYQSNSLVLNLQSMAWKSRFHAPLRRYTRQALK